jgi:hypothetical protein
MPIDLKFSDFANQKKNRFFRVVKGELIDLIKRAHRDDYGCWYNPKDKMALVVPHQRHLEASIELYASIHDFPMSPPPINGDKAYKFMYDNGWVRVIFPWGKSQSGTMDGFEKSFRLLPRSFWDYCIINPLENNEPTWVLGVLDKSWDAFYINPFHSVKDLEKTVREFFQRMGLPYRRSSLSESVAPPWKNTLQLLSQRLGIRFR